MEETEAAAVRLKTLFQMPGCYCYFFYYCYCCWCCCCFCCCCCIAIFYNFNIIVIIIVGGKQDKIEIMKLHQSKYGLGDRRYK